MAVDIAATTVAEFGEGDGGRQRLCLGCQQLAWNLRNKQLLCMHCASLIAEGRIHHL